MVECVGLLEQLIFYEDFFNLLKIEKDRTFLKLLRSEKKYFKSVKDTTPTVIHFFLSPLDQFIYIWKNMLRLKYFKSYSIKVILITYSIGYPVKIKLYWTVRRPTPTSYSILFEIIFYCCSKAHTQSTITMTSFTLSALQNNTKFWFSSLV